MKSLIGCLVLIFPILILGSLTSSVDCRVWSLDGFRGVLMAPICFCFFRGHRLCLGCFKKKARRRESTSVDMVRRGPLSPDEGPHELLLHIKPSHESNSSEKGPSTVHPSPTEFNGPGREASWGPTLDNFFSRCPPCPELYSGLLVSACSNLELRFTPQPTEQSSILMLQFVELDIPIIH